MTGNRRIVQQKANLRFRDQGGRIRIQRDYNLPAEINALIDETQQTAVHERSIQASTMPSLRDRNSPLREILHTHMDPVMSILDTTY